MLYSIASGSAAAAGAIVTPAAAQFAEGLRRYWAARYRLRRLTLFDFATRQTIRG